MKLFLMLLLASQTWGASAEEIGAAYCKFYGVSKKSDAGIWFRFVARETVEYSERLKIEKHADILAAAWIVESQLDHRAVAVGEDSYGVTQVRVKWADHHAEPLRAVGGMPGGTLSDPSVQIALGVSAYAVMLKRTGDPWAAIRRYNGKGWKAERHLRRVKRVHEKLFGVDKRGAR